MGNFMKITKIPSFCLLLLAAVADSSATGGSRLIPFQGRLPDAAGKPVPDGVRLIQFQIYSDPSAGSVLWAGELHHATINGGLVNVILGSKNPLPNDRLDQPDKSFFDQPLYLQITADANNDGQITGADSPLLPRQTILPVLFANESGNSRKLAGYDWTSLFGTNNPSGKIDGTRLANITSNAIAPQTINAGLIVPGGIGSNQIADAGILWSKLAGRRSLSPSNPNALDGEIAVSLPVQLQTYPAGTPTKTVTNLMVTLNTTGRPIFMGLFADTQNVQDADYNSSTARHAAVAISIIPGGSEPRANLYFAENGKQICRFFLGVNTRFFYYPASSFQHIHLAAQGPHTFTVQINTGDQTALDVLALRLVAFEL